MTDDLVERVARIKSRAVTRWKLADGHGDIVDYAIRIALEEATRVCRKIGASYLEQDGTRAVADECADAIEKLMVTKDV